MRSRYAVLSAVLVAGCVDTPLESPPESTGRPELVGAAALAAAPCTKTWASGIGGLWADPSRWSPNGVPGSSDDVCINAPGTYDVLATQPIDVRSLVIGGNQATVHFEFDPPVTSIGIETAVGIGVLPGSELTIQSKGLVPLTGGFLANFGTLDIENACACGGDVAVLDFDRIDNLKRMELDAPLSVESSLWTNGVVGVIVTAGQGVIDVEDGGTLRNWGRILGSTQIHVDNFDWKQGIVGETAQGASTAVVTGGTLDLSAIADAASGTIEADTYFDDVTVSGRVPPDVTVDVLAREDDVIRFDGLGPTGEFVVDGDIAMRANGTNVVNFERLVIRGRFEIDGTGDVEFGGSELINEGLLDVWGSNLTVTNAGGLFQQSGDIRLVNAVTLTMAPGTRLLSQGGNTPFLLTVVLEGATLEGYGSVGHVTSIGGTIEPELYRRLVVSSLSLDGSSELVIAYGEDGNGEIYASGTVTFDGTLRIVEASPAPGFGLCGDVITAVRHPDVTPTGSFTTYVGLNGAAGPLRVAPTPDDLLLVGYDPSRDVAVRYDSIAAREGESSTWVTVCLGANAPTADIVISAAPTLGELVAPAPITIDLAHWQAPVRIELDARDDAVIEPLEWDTLTYVLSSADPRYDGALPDRTPIAILDNDGSADLEIVVQNVPTAVTVGNVFEVVYRVTNHGTTESTGAVVILGLPTGTGGAVLEQAFGGTCDQDPTAGDYCVIAGADPGEDLILAVVYRATSAGDLSFGATVVSYQPDPDPANNSVQLQVVVN